MKVLSLKKRQRLPNSWRVSFSFCPNKFNEEERNRRDCNFVFVTYTWMSKLSATNECSFFLLLGEGHFALGGFVYVLLLNCLFVTVLFCFFFSSKFIFMCSQSYFLSHRIELFLLLMLLFINWFRYSYD